VNQDILGTIKQDNVKIKTFAEIIVKFISMVAMNVFAIKTILWFAVNLFAFFKKLPNAHNVTMDMNGILTQWNVKKNASMTVIYGLMAAMIMNAIVIIQLLAKLKEFANVMRMHIVKNVKAICNGMIVAQHVLQLVCILILFVQ